MSTLEAVRGLLCQAAETPPAEILKSAQEELARLAHLVQNAKNVLQRNGARKKLTELEPLIAKMEIEVGLVQLEQSLDQNKTGAQRAAARVQAQKLAAQIAALAPSEEKELFQQWLAEIIPSLASTPPGSAATSAFPAPAAPAPTLAPPSAASVVELEAPAIPPPLPDPTPEIQAALALLETRAKARPIVEPARIREELQILVRRVEALSASQIRTKLQASIDFITTTLDQEANRQRLGEAVTHLEQSATRPESELFSLSAEHERLATALAPLDSEPETEALRQRLGRVKATLAGRRETGEIETALQQCATELEKDPHGTAGEARLKTVVQRIGQLTDAKARATFSERSESLRKTITLRRQEAEIATSLTELMEASRAADASSPALRAELNELASRLQKLPASSSRSELENRIREARDAVAALKKKSAPKPPQTAVVLQLEPIKGRAVPSSRPMIFVARDRFSIGRKPENEPPRADLLTPSAELRVSRVHVTFLARQRQIHALSGDEGKPSTNPALLDETPLGTTPVAVSFENERRIDLTGVFTLRAQLLPSSTPYGPPFDDEHNHNHNTTVVVPPITGALRLRPQGEDRLPVTAVWLFTDATIGAHAKCAVTLPQSGMGPEEARIHFWKKSFWIEVLRAGATVQLAGKTLTPGAAQPLHSGQELQLGNSFYTIKLL